MRKTAKELLLLRQIASVDPASAGEAWRALSEAQTAIAAGRTRGLPYTVAVAPGATQGPPGLCAPGAAKILLDGDMLPCSPDELDPRGNSEHMSAMAAMHGVLIHECGHASHTPEDRSLLRDEPSDVQESVTLLEEIRMEAQVIRHRPDDARWLRASARDIILADSTVGGEAEAWGASVLLSGRVPAGSLQADDISEINDLIREALGDDTFQAIEKICRETVGVRDDDLPRLIELGRELAELRPKQDGGDGRIRVAIEGLDEGEIGDAEELLDMLDNAEAREEIERALQEAASAIAGSADGSAPKRGERLATAEERRARNDLSERFRRVRWRERNITRRSQTLPPGRLRSREAVRRSAEIAQGRMVTAQPWNRRVRRMVELPRLTCGVLVDTSGSMASAAHELAGSLWALSHAAHENGGRVAAALFGNTAETLWGAEMPPRHVVEIEPSGGTQFLPDGIDLLQESLLWEAEDGPRLLVIVSDGWWGSGTASDEAIARARGQGIRVLHIGIGMTPEEHGADQTLRIDSASDLAPVVGAAAVEELRNW